MTVYLLWMRCIKKTVETVINSDNNVIVQVKGNQKHLLEVVQCAEMISPAVSTYDQYEHTRNRIREMLPSLKHNKH
jgi:hypothetical protein